MQLYNSRHKLVDQVLIRKSTTRNCSLNNILARRIRLDLSTLQRLSLARYHVHTCRSDGRTSVSDVTIPLQRQQSQEPQWNDKTD